MKTKSLRIVGLLAISILLVPAVVWASTVAQASDDPPQLCTNLVTKITSVAATDGHTTPYDSQGAGGAPEGFDPMPLLETDVTIGGRTPSCLVAQLSAHSFTGYGFGDQFAVYQVNVDGLPMIGHTTGCSTSGGVNFACLLFDNTNGAAGHSYHFYIPINPGTHHVEVLYAGCCNGLGAYTAGILTLYHK